MHVPQPLHRAAASVNSSGDQRSCKGTICGAATAGGSVTPATFPGLLEQPDVDGGLVGGASLKPESFLELVRLARSRRPRFL